MKIICNKSNLLKGVNIVLKAVPSKTTMPILECILIDCNSGLIKLTANDMELGIETIIEGEIIEKGNIAIEAKFLSELVRKLPDNEVIIETDDNLNTTVTCEKSIINFICKSGEEFSRLPNIEREEYISISEYSLKEIIRQTIFSIADNDSNKMMTGEFFEIKDNLLRVVALDGHRMSIRKIELKDNYEYKKAIVPGKSLQEISKILTGETTQEVKMYFTKNHILFELENTIVLSRLIEGTYPSIDHMVTYDYNTKLKINKKELISCLERSMIFVREGENRPIIINIVDDIMKLKIISQKGGIDENIEINKEGNNIMVGYNPKFMIDIIKVIDDEEITMYFMNTITPCFIRNDENTYTYFFLPVSFNANM